MKQSRWKSKVLWASIAAQAIALAQLTGLFKLMGIDAGYAGDIVAGFLQLLVFLGVLNNPTDVENF